jgi:hypothetical protein
VAILGCSSLCISCQRILKCRLNREDSQLDLSTLWRDVQEAVFELVIATGRPLDFVGLVGGLRRCSVCSRSRLARRHLDAASGKQRRDEECLSGVVK